MQEILKNILKDLTKINANSIKINGLKRFNNISEYEFSLIKGRLELEKRNKTDIYFQFINKHKIKESIFCYWSLIYDEQCKKYHIEGNDEVIITELEVKKDITTILLEIGNKDIEILKYGTIVYFIDFSKYLKANNISVSDEIIKYLERSDKTTLLLGIKLNSNINWL